MPIIFFIVIISLFWGIGNVLVKLGYLKQSPWQTYALDAVVISLPLWLFYGYMTGGKITSATPLAWAAAFFETLVYGLFYYTVNKGPVGLVAPIIATYPVTTLFLSYLFLRERLTMPALIGVILATFGTVLISLTKKLRIRIEKWVIFSLLTSIGFGIAGSFSKLGVDATGNSTFIMILAISQIIVVFLWWLLKPEPLPTTNLKKSGTTLLGVFLLSSGNIVYFIALEKELSSIVVPLSNTYIIITTILSIFWLKEKMSLHQVIGIILVVIGVIFVNVNFEKSIVNNSIIGQISPLTTPTLSLTQNRESAKALSVIDGDTIKLANGKRVRYLGIDAPELGTDGKQDDCFAQKAKEINTSLVKNQIIEMEKDITNTDQYGRLLRYVFLDGEFISEFLVRYGYAKTINIAPDIKYSQKLKDAEDEAKENQRGLWKECDR